MTAVAQQIHFSTSKVPLNSLSRFDDSRVVTTPRSLLACELEGIDPEELVSAVSSPRRRHTSGSLEEQRQKLEDDFNERERRKLVEQAKKRYSQLSHASSRVGSASGALKGPRPPTHAAPSTISTATKKYVAGLAKDIAVEAALAIESDLTVPHQFLRLKMGVEEAARARAELEEKEATAMERYDAVKKTRQRKAEEQAERFDTRHEKVMSSKRGQIEEWRQKHEARLEQLQQRLEAADKQVELIKQTKSSKAASKRGEDERIASEQAKRERIDALEAKLEAASHAAQARKALKQQADHLAQLEMNLKHRAMDKARERAAKAQAFRQLQIREREIEAAEMDKERAEKARLDAKARHAAREIIANQRDEIKRYVDECAVEGLPTIPPPPWLGARIQLLREHAKRHGETTPNSPRPPGPTAIGGTSPHNNSARGKRPGGKNASPRANHALPSMVGKEKFTIVSPRIADQQCFGRWMYE